MTTVVGIDVQSISEVAESLKRFGTHYTERLFTSHEIECCEDILVIPASGYAERYAAKEAVLKILNVNDAAPSWKSIEVRCTKFARPEIVLVADAADIARRLGVTHIFLSMSHDDSVAVATVVAHVDLLRGSSIVS